MNHVYIKDWLVEVLEFSADDVIHVRCRRGAVFVEVVADVVLNDRVAVLSGGHFQGSGPNTVGPTVLRSLAREVRSWLGVDELRIEGATRTTGASPGHDPRPLIFR